MSQQLQHKISRPFAYKSLGNAIKDIDSTGRTVVFYANAFDKMDDQMDVLRKGAFAKSINEWGPRSVGTRKVKHCLFHDESQLPGVITDLSEDSFGLLVSVKMADTTLGRDTLEAYKDGIYTEHSIRMSYVDGRIKWVDDASLPSGGYFDVTGAKLWHTATVAFGSNEYTHVVGVKAITDEEERQKAITTINERMNALTKAIRNGKYSDEAFKQLAYDLAECQDAYNALLSGAQADKATLAGQTQRNQPATGKGTEAPDYSFIKNYSFVH